MKIHSKRFKRELEFSDEMVIKMDHGIPGFPDSKRFCILELEEEGSPFKWFHDVDQTQVALLITDPYLFFPEYNPRINQSALIDLDIQDVEEDMMIFTIVKITPGGRSAYTNLRAPVLVNVRTKQARQIILEDDQYSVSTAIFTEEQSKCVASG